MAKYRKLPIVVEALQYEGQQTPEMETFLDGENHRYSVLHMDKETGITEISLHIWYPEGSRFANAGDYIIKDVVGEYYPCNPHVFWATYELVDPDD